MGYAYDEGVRRNSGSELSVEEPEAEGRVGQEVAPAVEAPEGQVRQSSSDDAGDTPQHVGVAVGHDLGLLLPLQRTRLPMSEGIRGMQGTRLRRGQREESDHPQQAAHRGRQALRSREGRRAACGFSSSWVVVEEHYTTQSSELAVTTTGNNNNG